MGRILCLFIVLNLWITLMVSSVWADSASSPTEGQSDAERSLAMLNLSAPDLSKDEQDNVNQQLSMVLQREFGSAFVSDESLKKILQFGELSDTMDCTNNTECVASIASKAHSDLLLSGKVGRVGSVWVLTLQLLDIKHSKPIARVAQETEDRDALPVVATEAVTKILGRLKGLGDAIRIDTASLGKNPRIAIMDISATGVERTLAENMLDMVTVELKQFEGFQTISRQEIQTMLNFEEAKQGMGCDDDSCFAEIGNALGVQYLVTGTIGQLDETYMLTMKVIDIRKGKVIGREHENFVGPAEGLLPAVRFVVRRLFGAPYTGDGLLKLSVSEEGTSVMFDGKEIGQSPNLTLPGKLAAGKYRIDADKEGFHHYSQDIFIEPARQTHVQLNLEERPPKWWQTWWFWTTVGVVVAGGVTAGVVIGTMPADNPNTGSGTVLLNSAGGAQ